MQICSRRRAQTSGTIEHLLSAMAQSALGRRASLELVDDGSDLNEPRSKAKSSEIQ